MPNLDTKSSSYIYIKYVGFRLVAFYGIAITGGYLIPNPFYTYIVNMICEDILTMKFLELHLFVSTKLNGFKYCYVTVTI